MELEEFITESEIVEITKANQPTVHKWLKQNMERMITRRMGKRVLYHKSTLPQKIKDLMPA